MEALDTYGYEPGVVIDKVDADKSKRDVYYRIDFTSSGTYSLKDDNGDLYTGRFTVKGYPNSKLAIVKWPLSVIRVYSSNKDEAANLGEHILNTWINYSDEEVSIYAYTDGVRHNTITPIVRKKNGLYEMDLVLRNNLTTEEYPLGLFHPHPEYHNIKKENIGLIEVMGLAILPARLKREIQLVEEILLGNGDITEETEKHRAWIDSLKQKYTFTKENVDSIVKEEIGKTFGKILENAGVYKMTDEGIEHFIKFTKAL